MAEEEKHNGQQRRTSLLRQIISGSFLSNRKVQQMFPYIAYVMFIMFLYIANGYNIQAKHMKYRNLNAELKRLRTMQIRTASVRDSMTNRAEIKKLIEQRNLGLEDIVLPPKIVE